MGDVTDDPARPDGSGAERPIGERLLALEAEIRSLRRAVAALERSPREEIRCHRLVLVGADGFERVVIGIVGLSGHVTVYGRTAGRDSTAVSLFASDAVNGEAGNGDGSTAGVALLDRGDARVMLDVVSGRRPSLWFEPDES